MPGSGLVVLDFGKTHSKASLWSDGGVLLEKLVRRNETVECAGYHALDILGTEAWLEEALRRLAKKAEIRAIIPVAHGAAAVVVEGKRVIIPPLCYERFPASLSDADYNELRDDFSATGSPRLPGGLNLGAQLYRWGRDFAPELWPRRGNLVTYPQYWSWLLTGVAATEITSFGCHTDLWRPYDRNPSRLAERMGWPDRYAPLRHASEILGEISPVWVARTGLPRSCLVYCGIHDSNAAFHGARAYPQFSGKDLTVLSTGTWFVAMRAPADREGMHKISLNESRDTLVNVDLNGHPIPSARFMGGREIDQIQAWVLQSGDGLISPPKNSSIAEVVDKGIMALPSFVPGVGPFPNARGRFLGATVGSPSVKTAASLYLSLVANESLSLIGACDTILVEGPFSRDANFVSGLAALRRDLNIYTAAPLEDDLAFGARRLENPALMPAIRPDFIVPPDLDLGAYAERWRALAGRDQVAA